MNILSKKSFTVSLDFFENIISFLEQYSSPSRKKHSIEVAKLAKSLCSQYNVEPKKGVIAGISHDIARGLSDSVILKYAVRDGFPISEWEKRNTIVLHGRAAAVIIEKEFFIRDQEIIAAVRNHVTGSTKMGLLERIIFSADVFVSFPRFLDNSYRKKILRLDLDCLFLKAIKIKSDYLKKKGMIISDIFLKMYTKAKERVKLQCSVNQNP